MKVYEDLFERYGSTMTPTQAAQVLKCHPTHVRDMCRKQQLPGVLFGSRWIIPTAKFAEVLDGQGE